MAREGFLERGFVKLPVVGHGPSFPALCLVCMRPLVVRRSWHGHFSLHRFTGSAHEWIRPDVRLQLPYCDEHAAEFDRLHLASPPRLDADLRYGHLPPVLGLTVELWASADMFDPPDARVLRMLTLTLHFIDHPEYARTFAQANIDTLLGGVERCLELLPSTAGFHWAGGFNRDALGDWVQELGELADPRAIDALAETARSPWFLLTHYEVLEPLATAFASLGNSALHVLFELLEDEKLTTRTIAINALALSDELSATEALARHARDDPERSLRRRCEWALEHQAQRGNEAAVAIVLERLKDENPRTRRRALKGLARSGDPKAIEAIENIADGDPSWFARRTARRALKKPRSA